MDQLVAQEYFKIMDVIAQYDGLVVAIKGWSITVGVAIVGLALQQRNRNMLLLCLVSSMAFSFVDAKYKEYQVSYYSRMQIIEKCASGELLGKQCSPLRVDESWRKSKVWYGVFLQYRNSGVFMPHAFTFFVALFLYMRKEYFMVGGDSNSSIVD